MMDIHVVGYFFCWGSRVLVIFGKAAEQSLLIFVSLSIVHLKSLHKMDV